jgi:hypothetical protein
MKKKRKPIKKLEHKPVILRLKTTRTTDGNTYVIGEGQNVHVGIKLTDIEDPGVTGDIQATRSDTKEILTVLDRAARSARKFVIHMNRKAQMMKRTEGVTQEGGGEDETAT